MSFLEIERKENKNLVEFGTLVKRELFYVGSDLYMKSEYSGASFPNCVCLNDGWVRHCQDDLMVEPVNGKLVVE